MKISATIPIYREGYTPTFADSMTTGFFSAGEYYTVSKPGSLELKGPFYEKSVEDDWRITAAKVLAYCTVLYPLIRLPFLIYEACQRWGKDYQVKPMFDALNGDQVKVLAEAEALLKVERVALKIAKSGEWITKVVSDRTYTPETRELAAKVILEGSLGEQGYEKAFEGIPDLSNVYTDHEKFAHQSLTNAYQKLLSYLQTNAEMRWGKVKEAFQELGEEAIKFIDLEKRDHLGVIVERDLTKVAAERSYKAPYLMLDSKYFDRSHANLYALLNDLESPNGKQVFRENFNPSRSHKDNHDKISAAFRRGDE